MIFVFFFFNDTATTEIYTLSLHDALPIFARNTPGDDADGTELAEHARRRQHDAVADAPADRGQRDPPEDRKSTRLNSSHANISYAVFCLKKNKQTHQTRILKIHYQHTQDQ